MPSQDTSNIKVELTKDDCVNVQTCIMIAAKQANIDSSSMKLLLVLHDKFEWKGK